MLQKLLSRKYALKCISASLKTVETYRSRLMNKLGIGEAQSLLHKSLDLFTEFVTGWDIVQPLVYLGEATAAAGDLSEDRLVSLDAQRLPLLTSRCFRGDLSESRRIFLDALHLATEVQAIPLALDALTGLAHQHAQVGDAEQALELSICVLRHSASTQEAKDRAQQLRTQLESQLTPHQVEAVQARAQAKSIDVLVAELLNSCTRRPGEGCEPSPGLQEH